MILHNTLSGAKEPFVPLAPPRVGMYVCGVTVYAPSHIGHARALITFDVLFRYLRWRGYDVTFVRNFTDIDDKIINRAHALGIDPLALAEEEIAGFRRDVAALNCLAPTHEPRATRHIGDMIALIARLETRGLAYAAGGDVFYAVERFPGYGKLAHRRLEDMEAGARVEVDPRKRHPMDFALWKASKPGEPSWESPWGPGRPGWHIECSAMSAKLLGQPFDIHGGGSDLIFPHHENEIAQSEGASGRPFARYWIHNEMVTREQEKMSKSLGNFLTIREAVTLAAPETLRLFFLGAHYRTPLDFSRERLGEEEKRLERIYEALARADAVLGIRGAPAASASPGTGAASPAVEEIQARQTFQSRRGPAAGQAAPEDPLVAAVVEAMDDDLNTARALGHVFDHVRELNRALDGAGGGERIVALRKRRAALATVGEFFGIMQADPGRFLEEARQRGAARGGVDVTEIEGLIAERNAARGRRDFRRADEIRTRLKARGILLEDGPGGTTWRAEHG
jgi:cysteinyl-tRNA synthetase